MDCLISGVGNTGKWSSDSYLEISAVSGAGGSGGKLSLFALSYIMLIQLLDFYYFW
jgi:hypothetical protein